MPLERYTLHAGDTVATLAQTRELTVATIRELNGYGALEPHEGDDVLLPASKVAPLRAGLIIEGETLLPGHSRHTYVVRRGDTLASIAHRNHVSVGDLARLNGLAPHAPLVAGVHLVVEVQTYHRHRRHKVIRTRRAAAPSPARQAG